MQADLSLRWAHMSEGTFSHGATSLFSLLLPFIFDVCVFVAT